MGGLGGRHKRAGIYVYLQLILTADTSAIL